MNHNCHLANFQMVEEVVGLDAWESIKTSSVGVILRLKELNYTSSAKAVHHLLTNQLVVNNIHEIWSFHEDDSFIPGDYGVYALKYIECKAIGCGFEGFSDHQCIPAMRIKLAAEIYDEVSCL
ncbi:BnaC05g10170D [Brassica napus]|uniref:BnaC05g10170D protein n=1 Tax=Brassica napus TaxID=3708 RepID=A0A078HF50_BRANA|nr:BnaC05g10170D [Brassica napus]